MNNLNDLVQHFLKDMYYAEQQNLRSVPEMLRAAQSAALKQALETQAQISRAQVEYLEKVFEAFGQRPEGATCEALLGMLKEQEELLKDIGKAGPVQDAGLIAHLQAVLHYGIARYGTLLAWATELGQKQAMEVLRLMLEGARKADQTLNELATKGINKEAHQPA
jgi:ferritin-like metal-binding protein YciE